MFVLFMFPNCYEESLQLLVDDGIPDFPNFPPPDVQGTFQFIILTDTHVYNDDIPLSPKKLRTPHNIDTAMTIERINQLTVEAKFVIHIGDMVDYLPELDLNYYKDNSDDVIDEFFYYMNQLTIPYALTLGNHDVFIEFLAANLDKKDIAYQIWHENAYGMPCYYSFVYGGIKFIILNSYVNPLPGESAYGTALAEIRWFGNEQLQWLVDELEEGLDCFLFFHHPLLKDEIDIHPIIETYSDSILAIFNGHSHKGGFKEIYNIPNYIMSSVFEREDNIAIIKTDSANRTFTFLNKEELPWYE